MTLAAERPQWTGLALDVSEEALAVAKANATTLQMSGRLAFVSASWFPPGDSKFDLIISNPPYITSSDIPGLSADVRLYDPLLALDGGTDGLDAYRAIAQGAGARLFPNGLVVVEIGAGQDADVEAIFTAQGFALKSSRRDLGGHIRGLAFAVGH